jgi:Rha family phage regulatory protein
MLALHTNTNTNTTMTSREIAELTGKEHGHVMRDIRAMFETLEIGQSTFGASYLNSQNKEQPMFRLPYDETICLLTGYDAKARMAVIKRWQELEAQQATAFKVPQTLSEALRLAADQQDTIIAQALQLEAQAPAVEFVQKFVEAKSSKCLSDVAKILGKKPLAFINQLSDDHVIFKRNGSWIPYQTQLDAGRFTVKTGESSGHAYEQTRVEPKGIEWLAKIYG